MTYLPNSDFSLFTCSLTGNVFSTTRGINRMVNEYGENTKFYQLSGLQGVELYTPKTVEVLTAGGLQGVELWNEHAIKFVVKFYAKKGNAQALKTLDIFLDIGLKVYIQNETQFNQAHESVQEATGMTPWKSSRKLTMSTHNDFMNAAKAKRHPAAQIHDLITSLVTGYTAQEARADLKLVEGDKSVGLNYQPSDEHLKVIGEAKRLYTTYRKGSWQDQARRAVFHASAD